MIAGRDYLVPVNLDPERDREAWLAARLQGHGGSDVAKILNEHPKEGPIDVWLAHTGGDLEPRDDTERSRAGRFMEPHVLDWFARGGEAWPRSGGPLTVIKPPTVYHRDRPWQLGSVDGICFVPESLLGIADSVDDDGGYLGSSPDLLRRLCRIEALAEVKTHGWFASRAYSLDDDDDDPIVSVPADKRIQVAWYQELYDVDAAYLAALVDTHLRRTFFLPRDRELGAMLLEEVEQFRKRYILTGEAPPPSGKASYRDYLKRRFKTHDAEIVESSDAVDIAVESLLAIKRDQKRLKGERELAEQVIKKHIGEHAGVKSSSGIVTWKSQRSGKYRDKDMRAELYRVAGWTDDEIAAFEEQFALGDNRVLRTPGKD
jgi:predicted phage-related endonuclease